MKAILVSFIVTMFSLAAFAQDKQAVTKVIESQRLAWNRGDIEAYMQGYWKSDSLTFVGKTGPVYGWQKTLERYKKAYPGKAGMGQLTFNILQVKVLDKANAFVLRGLQLKRVKDPLGGYFTLWFRKMNGEWKIVWDHTS